MDKVSALVNRIEKISGTTRFALSFLASLFFTPLSCIVFLFIPIIGQLTSIAALCSTIALIYFWRSWTIGLGYLCGAVSSALFVIYFGRALNLKLDVPIFLMLGFGLPLIMAYSIAVVGLIAKNWNSKISY